MYTCVSCCGQVEKEGGKNKRQKRGRKGGEDGENGIPVARVLGPVDVEGDLKVGRARGGRGDGGAGAGEVERGEVGASIFVLVLIVVVVRWCGLDVGAGYGLAQGVFKGRERVCVGGGGAVG